MPHVRIITITLSTAIDRIIEARGVAAGRHVTPAVIDSLPAGKGINVSRALARLGRRSIASGLVGKADEKWFTERLRSDTKGLAKPLLVPIAARTRVCKTIRDRASLAESHLRAPAPRITERDFGRLERRLLPLVDQRTIIALCGSVPPGLGIERLRRFLGSCQDRGARIALDTSGRALTALAREPLWLLKINADELSGLACRPITSPRGALIAARQLQKHIPIVVITLGAQGAVAFTPDGEIRAQSPRSTRPIRRTVGCGDVFLAALLVRLHADDAQWEGAVRYATRTATAFARRRP